MKFTKQFTKSQLILLARKNFPKPVGLNKLKSAKIKLPSESTYIRYFGSWKKAKIIIWDYDNTADIVPIKNCDVCGKEIKMDEWLKKFKGDKNLLLYTWKVIKYCSQKCSNNKRDMTMPFKICKNCGDKYYRLKEESKSYFLSRIYCSKECKMEAFSINRLAKNMGMKSEHLKQKLLELNSSENKI
jgi:hypothetical protein